MENKIFDLIVEQDEIAWKAILYELVKTQGMDPWDIDVSELTQRFLIVIKKLKELDLKISGKMILAAALLVKIKSDRFLGEDLLEFDKLFEPEDENSLFDDDEDDYEYRRAQYEKYTSKDKQPLIPKTPQPRKRKVSIYDLVDALEKALTVKRRRVLRELAYEEIKLPQKGIDMTKLIENVYKHITTHLKHKKQAKLNFKDLIVSDKKEDKVYTFIPLLHLSQLRRVDLEQVESFSDIFILLTKKQSELKTEEIDSLDMGENSNNEESKIKSA